MKNPQTFVFIHGAWHASWCWSRIAAKLLAEGHRVLTPDLPGHGTNKKPGSAIDLNAYISSVVSLIRLQPEAVTLVGHSMAGLIISGVAEIIPEAIRELVFVAAFIPQHKKSLFSIAEELVSTNLNPFLLIDEGPQEIRLALSPSLIPIFFNCCQLKDAQYAMSKLQTESLRAFTDQVQIGEQFFNIPMRSLICTYDQVLLPIDQLNMSKGVTDNIVYLEADHAAYYSAAQQIVGILLNKRNLHA